MAGTGARIMQILDGCKLEDVLDANLNETHAYPHDN